MTHTQRTHNDPLTHTHTHTPRRRHITTTTTTALRASALAPRIDAIESLHTYHVLGRAEGPVRAHRNVTLGNLHRIRRTHTTVSTPARRQHPHHDHPPRECVSLPRVSLATIDDRVVAYLGRARLLDARTGGVGGLGGNHGVGLGNHRRRVTSTACVCVVGRPMATARGRSDREVDR